MLLKCSFDLTLLIIEQMKPEITEVKNEIQIIKEEMKSNVGEDDFTATNKKLTEELISFEN